MEDNPLKARPRKKKTGPTPPKEDETPAERDNRIMDEKFMVFDYTKKLIDENAELEAMEDLGNTKADPIFEGEKPKATVLAAE